MLYGKDPDTYTLLKKNFPEIAEKIRKETGLEP